MLDAVVALTRRRVNVPAVRVLEHLHGPDPSPARFLDLRLAVLRLERDGLVRSDVHLDLEATPDGEVAVGLLRTRGAHGV